MARSRTVVVAGVRFFSEKGHYYSECGQWAVFHMLRGTPQVCWELFTIDGDRRADVFIDTALTLGEIVAHGKRGDFTLRDE